MENVAARWDEQCERQVLQNCMTYYQSFLDAKEYIDADCFYFDVHKKVWQAIENAAAKGLDLNVVTVYAELCKIDANAKFDIITAINREPMVTNNIVPYAIRLKELVVRRDLLVLGQELITAGTQEVRDLDEVRQYALDKVQQLFEVNGSKEETLADGFSELLQTISDNQKNDGKLTGTPTGISALDKKGGLQPSDLIIIAGESSMGKTALSLKIAHSAIQNNEPIAFYSMEMTKKQLSARLVSFNVDISSSDLLYSPNISTYKYEEIKNTMTEMKAQNLYLDEKSTSNIDNILVSLHKLVAKYKIKGAIIDYLQILNMNTKKLNKEQAIAEAARKLKNAAKELGIWIIALSQLNRNPENPEPTLNRLRDSGQIVEAADLVILIYRPEVYGRQYSDPYNTVSTKGTALINLAKGRNIGTAKFIMGFDARRTLFYDMASIPERRNDENDSAPF